MKIIAIPDIHGQEHWKKAKSNIDAVDKTKAPLVLEHENNGRVILIDTPRHNCIVEIDTATGEYRVV